jgi:antitoxin CcdA
MQTTLQNSHLEWLQGLTAHFKISLSEIARLAGVSPSTLTRFVKAGARESHLRADTIGKIVSALGVDPPALPEHMAPSASMATIPVSLSPKHLLEAQKLGLNLKDVLRVAAEKEIRAERLRQWSERNQKAAREWDKLIEDDGLWSDGLRQF